MVLNKAQMLFWGHTAEKSPAEKVTDGHENIGLVAEVDPKVREFRIGDKVGCLGCSYACCRLPCARLKNPVHALTGLIVCRQMIVRDVWSTTCLRKRNRKVAWCSLTALIWLPPHHSSFSHRHGIRPHLTIFTNLDDINSIINMMKGGKYAGRLGIVFSNDSQLLSNL